ncbi:hypothetical protein CDL15_Pgr022849 [Punica granatum]|uniref:Major facilitator superfamily (MFS) profile domain-containing protein n=1 Tax=Punica granatum TaxID=22663 RepID=A0A218X381_PUNGR|nr:hypothetical protein CDL15_Pgr022849 [Punica granatum]
MLRKFRWSDLYGAILEEILPRSAYEDEARHEDQQLLQIRPPTLNLLHLVPLVASSFASPLIRAFGRKPSILVEGAAFLTSAALGGSAFNVYMLIFSRVLLGVGSVPLCMSEMAPSRYSGAFSNGFKFCVATGNLSANIINYGTEKIKGGWGWRLSLALAVVPASILTLGVGALFFPETPNSLIQQGNNREKANSVLRRIRGTNNVKKEFDEDLVKASSVSKISTACSERTQKEDTGLSWSWQ